MSVAAHIPKLQRIVSKTCEILTDHDSIAFQEHCKRWTDIDRKIPAAIILPREESDIQRIVQWAVESSVSFVVKSGGASEWSTIGDEGVVVDLAFYSSVSIDERAHQLTITGGVTQKEVATKLAEKGLFTALGNGNPVGVTGYVLGGGSSITNSITGYGSDQILSARLVTASGSLIEVTPDNHPDLLYGLRGAGHFFSLVTSLTLQAYPFSLLGTSNAGTIWLGAIVFPLHRAPDVVPVMSKIMSDPQYPTAGLMMIGAPPPAKQPSLIVSARCTSSTDIAETAFAPLRDLQPIVFKGSQVPIQNVSDGRDAFYANGSYKRFGTIGLRRFDSENFLQTIEVWKELVAECPDALSTTFNFQWDSRPVKKPPFESAMSLHDTQFWQNNFLWYTSSASRDKVEAYNEKCMSIVRSGESVSEWVDYQNATRTGPIERRFRGKRRLEKLRQLKKEWDPQGVFTSEFL